MIASNGALPASPCNRRRFSPAHSCSRAAAVSPPRFSRAARRFRSNKPRPPAPPGSPPDNLSRCRFPNPIVRCRTQFLRHQGNDVRLRDCLVITDRQWTIFVTAVPHIVRNKFFARDLRHRRQHALVLNAPRRQLLLHHLLALTGKILDRHGLSPATHRCERRQNQKFRNP